MVATLPNDVFLPFAPDKPWLAPLAGWSDLPFRLLCRRFGAAVCCTEMISAKGLIYIISESCLRKRQARIFLIMLWKNVWKWRKTS